ncbi:hypothetical protein O6H91_04G040300 [Diphasiastrum complanatum]|uniref:Uncharacterized protein n=2 Tax=Diphasiastrum complanatum TaxID=34168 RepID=A0ACC2DWC1_DIPCM|nr:hypothetical protein O6H91_04G040300 [Diphasiastrum complanatum]KAJ7558461.1 hypothetical protein O6H91_04G040300 [Diphasiastrum complanatum]
MSQESQFAYIYQNGPYDVELIDSSESFQDSIRRSTTTKKTLHTILTPPKPLLVAVPQHAGEFPVIMLQHGFVLKNYFYRQLMQHIASHGSIVIAPQMYDFAAADATPEINEAAAVINWLPNGLIPFLGDGRKAKPDFNKLALIGHSRGGKVVFALALGLAKLDLKICAVIGLDPVDGTSNKVQTQPHVLRFSEYSFNFDFPTLVVGAGLGCLKRNLLFPPCAPEGVSHKAFFHDCGSPAFHFVAPEYGHMDFLDDQTQGTRGKITYCLCKNGPSRSPMRKFSGGIVVAFLLAVFDRKCEAFYDAIQNYSLNAPVKLEQPESHGDLPI